VLLLFWTKANTASLQTPSRRCVVEQENTASTTFTLVNKQATSI
jgi:hypothetical protein